MMTTWRTRAYNVYIAKLRPLFILYLLSILQKKKKIGNIRVFFKFNNPVFLMNSIFKFLIF